MIFPDFLVFATKWAILKMRQSLSSITSSRHLQGNCQKTGNSLNKLFYFVDTWVNLRALYDGFVTKRIVKMYLTYFNFKTKMSNFIFPEKSWWRCTRRKSTSFRGRSICPTLSRWTSSTNLRSFKKIFLIFVYSIWILPLIKCFSTNLNG